MSGELQLDGKHTLWALHVRGFPIPGWSSSRMRHLRIRRADWTPSFCVKDLNFKRFGIHEWGAGGVSWNQSSADKEGQLFEEQDSFLEADITLARVQAWECGLGEARQESGGPLIAAGGQVGPARDGWCC